MPYVVSVPSEVSGSGHYTLLVNLHSCHRNPITFEKCLHIGHLEMERWESVRGLDNVVIVHPTGFGNTLFMGLGELDVLACMEDISQKIHIAPDRVFLVGFSMGGAGALHMAAHHPGRFRGACSIGGYANHELWRGPGRPSWSLAHASERARRAASSLVENLSHTSLFIAHGSWDLGVGGGVSFAHFVDLKQRLEEFHTDATFVEHKKISHAEFPISARQEVIEWIQNSPRIRHTKTFSFVAASPRHTSFRQVEVLGFRDYSRPARVSGVAERGIFRLTTTNASLLLVDPKYGDVSADTDVVRERPVPAMEKRPERAGPIGDVHYVRPLFCYDDSAPARSREIQRQLANADARYYRERNAGISCGAFREGCLLYDIRIAALSEPAAPDDALVIYGSPCTNSRIRKLYDGFPIRISGDGIRIGNLQYDCCAARFIQPRGVYGYYVVNLSSDEARLGAGFGLWYGMLPDYVIYDSQRIRAFGYFDAKWTYKSDCHIETTSCTS